MKSTKTIHVAIIHTGFTYALGVKDDLSGDSHARIFFLSPDEAMHLMSRGVPVVRPSFKGERLVCNANRDHEKIFTVRKVAKGKKPWIVSTLALGDIAGLSAAQAKRFEGSPFFLFPEDGPTKQEKSRAEDLREEAQKLRERADVIDAEAKRVAGLASSDHETEAEPCP